MAYLHTHTLAHTFVNICERFGNNLYTNCVRIIKPYFHCWIYLYRCQRVHWRRQDSVFGMDNFIENKTNACPNLNVLIANPIHQINPIHSNFRSTHLACVCAAWILIQENCGCFYDYYRLACEHHFSSDYH